MFGLEGAAHQHMRRLTGPHARGGRLDSGDAGPFLAHEGARRTGDLVHDRNVAGEQVGQLCQEQGRPEFGGQLLVEQDIEVIPAFRCSQDVVVDSHVALAAAGCHHHIHGGTQSFVGLDAGIVQGQAGHIGAQPLPGFHLTLVAALGDLQVPVDLGQGMDGVGSEALRIEQRLGGRGRQLLPVRIRAFPERGNEANAGDDDVVGFHGRFVGQRAPPVKGGRRAGPLIVRPRSWRRRARRSSRRGSS